MYDIAQRLRDLGLGTFDRSYDLYRYYGDNYSDFAYDYDLDDGYYDAFFYNL